MIVAIYARFSSDDLQDRRSIADQVEFCREHLKRIGIAGPTEIYSDEGISGAHLKSRPAMLRLMADAKAGRVSLIVAEALDRISRDLEDTAGIFKRLRHAGVRLLTVAEGDIDAMKVAFKGAMNADFLEGLAAKVRRGQRGRVREGRIPGGRCYGYRIERRLDARDELVRGLRSIDPAEAATVRRIFHLYIGGASPRAIAARLNAEGVKSPRGGQWNASSINGSRARRNGILHNELYAGTITYNRQTFPRDPETGRNRPRTVAESDWLRQEAPQLRIVDRETWDAAQALKARWAGMPKSNRARPKHLLSGMLICAACGSSFVAAGPGRLACTGRRERGACDNARWAPIAAVEDRVLAGLKATLMSGDVVATFLKTYREEMRRLAGTAAREGAEAGKRLAQIEAQLARLTAAIAETGLTPAMKAKLGELEIGAAAARERAAEAGKASAVVELHPQAVDHYRAIVDRLQDAIARRANAEAIDDSGIEELRALIRPLVRRIEISDGGKRGRYGVKLIGELAALIPPAGTQLERLVMTPGVGGQGSGRYHPIFEIAC